MLWSWETQLATSKQQTLEPLMRSAVLSFQTLGRFKRVPVSTWNFMNAIEEVYFRSVT